MIELKRISYSDRGTFGVLLKDKIPLCLTLEDPWKDNKKNVSCIPEGKYKCVPHNGTKYKNVWRIKNVIGRSAILIHAGNTENDTEGCILVGQSFGRLGDKVAVLNSQNTLAQLRGVLPDHFEIVITGD